MQAVFCRHQVVEIQHRAYPNSGNTLHLQITAGAGNVGAGRLNFVLFINDRRAPGAADVGKQRQVGRGFPDRPQMWRPAGVGDAAVIMPGGRIAIVIARRAVGLARIGDVIEAHAGGDGQAAVADRVLQIGAAGFLLARRHIVGLEIAVVVAGAIFLRRVVHQRIAFMLMPAHAEQQFMIERAAAKAALVVHIELLIDIAHPALVPQ